MHTPSSMDGQMSYHKMGLQKHAHGASSQMTEEPAPQPAMDTEKKK